MTRLDLALDSIRFARAYTTGLLDAVPEEKWFQMPEPAVTHVAWQVGHLAWAQFRLVFGRVLERGSGTADLIPDEFADLFGKGSQPSPDSARYPTTTQIRAVFDSVHAEALRQASTLADSVLDELSEPPHPAFTSKYGALLWSARHELIHAGQIALLRRFQGEAPLR